MARAMTVRPTSAKMRVLISGGAGGVGLACAEALASCGVELILCDVDGVALTDVSKRLNAFARYCDAIEENSVAIFANELAERLSGIDVLINAAGNGYIRALAMMRMARAFMPLLRRGGGRRVLVNVAPPGGFVSSDGMFPHCSSLGAFERLSEALREQVKGTSIEVATIVPNLLPASLQSGERAGLHHLNSADHHHTAQRVVALLLSERSDISSAQGKARR